MIEKLFENYKDVTVKIINYLKSDKDVDKLMEERASLIDQIQALEVSKAEKKMVYDNLELSKLDNELERTIRFEMSKVKDNIKKLSNIRAAHSSYASSVRRGNLFARKV